MRISDWSSDVCSSDLSTATTAPTDRRARAAVLTASASPCEVRDVELRARGERQLIVRTTAAPFCSTDWMGWRAMRRKSPPVILGHTAIGVVETVGSGVSELRAGQSLIVRSEERRVGKGGVSTV